MSVIANNDVVTVTMFGRLHQQNVLNVFDYVYEGDPVSSDQYTAAMAEVNAQFLAKIWDPAANALRDALHSDYLLGRVRTQVVYPIRGYYIEQDVNQTGTVDESPCLPSGAQVCITLQGEQVGQGRTGAKHLAGIPAPWTGNSLLLPAFAAIYKSASDQWLQTFNLVLNGAALRPIIWSKSSPGLRNRIRGLRVQGEVRHMVRRTVGRGI